MEDVPAPTGNGSGVDLLLFLLPWVAMRVFVGIFPMPDRLWLRVPWVLGFWAWVLISVVWTLSLIFGWL